MSSSNNNSNHSANNEIPQFVVIRDQVHSIYKHPIVHYVFEDEPFPEVPKDNLIMVDLDEHVQLDQVESYSPHFQVTNCRLDHNSTVYDQFEGDHDGSGLMTIEGVSAPRAEAIESLQPVRNLDNLKETLVNFKLRNEMVKSVFSPVTTTAPTQSAASSSSTNRQSINNNHQ
ncbi:hypothetical protein BDA99DRAFT_22248 [Phascolomyces articulosus]|uniref:Uncharacterized protein n=1 Tax=Phascolomyces articulosus TaxID=60185 RepID=A0AAD5KCL5_9FUNG|nr:hypothetical protein BDA99DRAFT_22248 [Phascolomyces articulosus]